MMPGHAQEVLSLITAAQVRGRPTFNLRDAFLSGPAGKPLAFDAYVELRLRNTSVFQIQLMLDGPNGMTHNYEAETVYPAFNRIQLVFTHLWWGSMLPGWYALHVAINNELSFTRVIEVL
ncbi:MAG: hypothetical protein IT462_03490 [Planctomycetes bacterium]|nr:hypothetical protein [Planctomycetota bacterium]